MNIVDRQAIEDLFTRLKEAERTSGPRDAEAEAMIARLVARQPVSSAALGQRHAYSIVQPEASKVAE